MKTLELKYADYELQLREPFITSKETIKSRKGFLITLKTSNNIMGIGDAAPFPEFGSESFEEAEKMLQELKLNISLDLDSPVESLKDNLEFLNKYPAVKHGIEQALLEIICRENQTSLKKLVKRESKNEISVNAVIGMNDSESVIKKVKTRIEEGFKTLKIKAGRKNFNEDFEIIKVLKENLGNDIKLRIDVNGKWNLSDAIENINKLSEFDIEYIEEPVSGIENFAELKRHIKLPVAVDESIRDTSTAENFIKNQAMDFIILKPMMIGGLIPSLKIVELAEKENIGVIITSSFESSIGRSTAIFLASVLKTDYAHGLAVNDYFVNDIEKFAVPVINGKIKLR